MSQGQVLLFFAGGMQLGVSLADVGRLVVEDTLLIVPFAHPALAGLLAVGDAEPVPVFDLLGLVDGTAVATSAPNANVALFPTARGPVGLRLERLDGTAHAYRALDADAAQALYAGHAPALLATVTGAAATAEGVSFSFFSPEAFLAALNL